MRADEIVGSVGRTFVETNVVAVRTTTTVR